MIFMHEREPNLLEYQLDVFRSHLGYKQHEDKVIVQV